MLFRSLRRGHVSIAVVAILATFVGVSLLTRLPEPELAKSKESCGCEVEATGSGCLDVLLDRV